jgi:hypothetical protein
MVESDSIYEDFEFSKKVGGRKKKYMVSNFTILWIPLVVVLVSHVCSRLNEGKKL